jgi:DNA modification methylase
VRLEYLTMIDINQYNQFLFGKIKVAEKRGIHVEHADLHYSLRPDQKDVAVWCLELGAALIAIDAGGGKTRIGIAVMDVLQKKYGGKCLIATELGAADTFIDKDPEVGEGVCMDLDLQYVTNDAEAFASSSDIVVTNYERIRDGNFDFSLYTAVWLDEGNYIKNMASKTTDALRQQLAKVKWKFIATATPSPNENLELVNYAHALGICDRGQILTMFFKRNSTKAGELTLKEEYELLEQHTDSFWLWLSSWCICTTSPADLGYEYDGFVLPKLNLHWVEVTMNKAIDAGADRDGQHRMFITSRSGLAERSRIKKSGIDVRIEKAIAITQSFPDDHFILWHHLEAEREALNKAFKGNNDYADIFGRLDEKLREKRVVDFTKGHLKYLATKPELNGVGCNFQKHCNKAIFVGINDSFDAIYQAIKRIWRFYNPFAEVDIYLLYLPEEYEIVLNLQRKWNEHNIMREKMRLLYQKFGLFHSKHIEEKKRSFKQDRKVWKSENYTLINNDCVFEIAQLQSNSVDMILTSIPFGNHYEYTDKYNDFGHNVTNEDFFKQMDYLVPELLRVLKPGRIAAFHTKNRIHYGSVTGKGFSTFHRFTHKACDCFERNGFDCMGFHYVPTDVVAENNQTYRLGFTEACKDMAKMGAGIPEEIWIFRKAPTSNATAYADTPVTHNKARCCFCGHEDIPKYFQPELEIRGLQSFLFYCKSCKQYLAEGELRLPESYTLSHWQLDADSFWRSSGNRYLTTDEFKMFGIDKLQAWWKKFNSNIIYDYDAHVQLLQTLDAHKKLSRTFTTLPLRSNTPYVWNDVNRMHGLNMEQSRRKLANHICPMPFDQVDRLIELYSNAGETILDPFGGLGTTGVRAVRKKRKAILTELNDLYAKTAAMYLKETEYKAELPTLFDLLTKAV